MTSHHPATLRSRDCLDSFPLGTDGWRGILAEGCTFGSIRRLAAAVAHVYPTLPAGNARQIVVGHDTRFLSPELAGTAAAVLQAAGLTVSLTDRPIPTPAVSHHVRSLGLAGGIAITASHNPAAYNGFKIKEHFGGSATQDLYDRVDSAAKAGKPPGRTDLPVATVDLWTSYRDRLAALVDLPVIRKAGLHVLADSMHGAAGTLVEDIAGGAATRVDSFRAERDVLFGGVHPEPIAANLGAAAERLRSAGCDLAVACDGDADRLGVLDRRGRFVSPHRVLALLLLHAFRRRGLSGGIAKTFSTSLLIDRVAAALNAPLWETAIGFKYVAELMTSGRAAAGGEESGGYAFGFHLPERDGVLNALLLLESLSSEGIDLDAALAALAREFGEFAYGRRDVYLPVRVIGDFLQEIGANPDSSVDRRRVTEVRAKDGIKYLFEDRGWLLHRLSGTEPMIRLYCEHEDPDAVGPILDQAQERLTGFATARGATPRF